MKIIALIAEALRSFWRPILAFTIVLIIATDYFVLPVLFHTPPYQLPDQFWQLAISYSLFYAGYRMIEKVTKKESILDFIAKVSKGKTNNEIDENYRKEENEYEVL